MYLKHVYSKRFNVLFAFKAVCIFFLYIICFFKMKISTSYLLKSAYNRLIDHKQCTLVSLIRINRRFKNTMQM